VVRLEDSCRAAPAAATPLFAGNKRWKLQHWINQDDFPAGSFLVSYGGYQSNAMLALAQLARMKRIGFVYYTKSLPPSPTTTLETTSAAAEAGALFPNSNLAHALALGMQIKSLPEVDYGLLFGDGHHDAATVPPKVVQGTTRTSSSSIISRACSEVTSLFNPQSAGRDGRPSRARRAPSSYRKALPVLKQRHLSALLISTPRRRVLTIWSCRDEDTGGDS
jgi:hypothetical protein